MSLAASTPDAGLSGLAMAIAADPRFVAAIHASTASILGLHAANADASRLMSDRAQFHIMAIAFALDPQVTPSAVNRLLPPAMASRNRVGAYLASLESGGALLPATDSVDGRRRPRRLAPAFADFLADWGRAIVAPALPWVKGPVPDLDAAEAPRGWYRQFVAAHARGFDMLGAAPQVARGFSLRGGSLIMLELMHRATAPGPLPRFSHRGFAARFDLSRSQVIALVDEFTTCGWLVADANGPAASPALIAQGRAWQAMHFAVAARVLEGRLADALDSEGLPPAAGTAMRGE